ncbi:MAG: FG-GAP-like repeat-containing protein [Prevotella sp.]|jgi:RHS repeat-associated protein|nr:FG-GAP-like repeat-containing protein [Prevotella sp.]
MRKILPAILSILFNLTLLNAQTGNTMSNPIVAGTFSADFSYSNSQNTTGFTNSYTGKSTNDVYYKFTLNKKMTVTMTHCGSTLSDTFLYLLSASGSQIDNNDDCSTEQCSNIRHSFLKKDLDAGTYYVVSEGYSANGVILTSISGTVTGSGESLSDPIIAGTFSSDFSYSNSQNTTNFTNAYVGKSSNDVFYKLTLNKKTEITISHCGSTLSDTYLYLLDVAGTVIAYNDDYSGVGQCSSTLHSYLKKDLDAGVYYIVSEGYSTNGVILTNISGKVYNLKGDNFNDPIDVGVFSGSFDYSDTQNTVNYTNQHTVRTPNDIFYKFTLTKKALVTMTHCGSAFDTYMTLLDASGNTLAVNDDYLGEGACSASTLHSFIQQTLDVGTYYIVSEGYSSSGLITTGIIGYSSEEFGYTDIPNAYSSDTDPVGAVGGNFNVSPTGAATISIPIEVPQGVGGMQPSLAIVYNSQSGNGVAGWGCNLSGLSAITRAPKDIYHDGTASKMAYLGNDAFYLDGQRLIYSSGTAGQEGAVYYPESDPFTKVIFHGTYNTGTADAWFEIQHSNGMKSYYGNTASGRQSYTSGSSPRINAWYLDYLEDPMGNYMTYSYYNWSYFMYPNTITYGNNKNTSTGLTNTVAFNYSYRNDSSPFYIENVKGYMNYRLNSISARTGSNVYRTYELTYNDTGDGSSTKFSRLTKVTLKNGAGEALKPFTLNWNYLPSMYQSVNTVTVNTPASSSYLTLGEQQFTSGDFNGDGLTDIASVTSAKILTGVNSWTYDTYAYIYSASLDSYGKPQFSTGSPYSLGASFDMGDWRVVKGGPFAVDFNGDGINDLLVPNLSIINEVNYKVVEFRFAGGALHNKQFLYQLKNTSEMPLYASADVNKDGKQDLIVIEKDHSNNKYACDVIGLNSGTTLYRASLNLTLSSKPEKLFLSDYNGDGLDDILVFYSGGYCIFWNQGNGISTSTFSDSYRTTGTNIGNVWMIRSGDFNGDGRMDFIMNDTGDSNWHFALNNGNGIFNKVLACTLAIYDQDFTSYDNNRFGVQVLDFDNDGKSDVIITKAMYDKKHDKILGIVISTWGEFNTTYSYWMRSTGTALTQERVATSKKEHDALPDRYLTGDFNGDGQVDLINYGYNFYSSTNASADPVWRFYKNSINSGNGKISSVTDSYGSNTSVSYASFANGGIYTKGTGSVYPMADYTIPIHAVESVTANNGVAGSMTTNYQYSGLKVHLQGKGMLGFASQTATNTTLGTVTESGIKTWNTTFFIPSATYSKTTVDGKTAETNITLSVADKGSKKYFIYPSTRTDKDLEGNTATTTYKFNSTYGYQEEEKVDFGNNMYKTVQYSNYILAGGSYKPQLVTLTQKHADDAAVFTKKTAITYDAAKGYRTQVIANYDSSLLLTTDYTYDAAGNVLTTVESGSGISPVTVNNVYDAAYRFLTKTFTTPASLVKSYTYDAWGNVLTEKDETLASNILTTTHTYDTWGNVTSTVYPDGNKKSTKWGWNNNASKRYFILSQATGSPWTKTWYDNKGREVLVETIGEKSMAIKQTTSYNTKGQVTQKQSQTGNLTTTESFTYDARGRVASSGSSSGQSSTYSYGNRTETTVTNGRTFTKTMDAWGNVKYVTDPVSSIAYTYYSNGKPKTTGTGNAFFSMTYDAVGNQATLTDPNAGTYTYTYDAAGRITKQVDGNGKETTNTYDALGRPATTVIDGTATTYTYGTSGYGLLRLTKVQTGNNYSAYTYDNLGRMLTEQRNIDGSGLLEFSYGYNTLGQLSSVLYPGSVQVNRQYDSYGNLSKVLAGTQAIWESTGATGTFYTSVLGGTLIAASTYNSQGLLTNLRTMQGSAVLRNMDYEFDGATGNLASRTGMIAQTESFTYDDLDRLTTIKHGTTTVMSMDYLPNGNINSKTGLGLYSYGTRPHAVTAVENTGNLLPANDQIITYTAFNKAASISETVGTDNMLLNITYGPDQQRWKTELKKNDVLQKTIIFAGDYESVTEGSVTKQLYYISGGDGLAAVYVKQQGQTDKIYYVHKDHLGSIVKLTDGDGTEVFKASYDAWGNRTVTNNSFAFHRGYTEHEHLEEFGLINMNGRMYDPVLGRFLSPDPYVQMMLLSQNYNRYSYCLNNPFKFTDPSGEWFWIPAVIIGAYLGGSSVNGNFNPAKWDYNNWQTYAGIAVGGVAGYAGAAIGTSVAASAAAGGASTFSAGVAGGMMGGMVSGGINGAGMTAIMGGNFNDIMGNMTMGMVIGGFGGALSGGIGAAIGDFSGVAGSSFKNGMYELGHSALKGAATGLASGAMMAAMKQDASYLWKGAAMGAALSVGMAGVRIGLMGSAIVPLGVKERFAADDAAFGIKNSYPIYRRGGLLRYFTSGITLGRNMMVDAKYIKDDPSWYHETLAHERAHIYQQKIMGSFNFYKRILYEYLINPGYSNNPYVNPNCLDYWADEYARLTP